MYFFNKKVIRYANAIKKQSAKKNVLKNNEGIKTIRTPEKIIAPSKKKYQVSLFLIEIT
jgi:hypothetical protein